MADHSKFKWHGLFAPFQFLFLSIFIFSFLIATTSYPIVKNAKNFIPLFSLQGNALISVSFWSGIGIAALSFLLLTFLIYRLAKARNTTIQKLALWVSILISVVLIVGGTCLSLVAKKIFSSKFLLATNPWIMVALTGAIAVLFLAFYLERAFKQNLSLSKIPQLRSCYTKLMQIMESISKKFSATLPTKKDLSEYFKVKKQYRDALLSAKSEIIDNDTMKNFIHSLSTEEKKLENENPNLAIRMGISTQKVSISTTQDGDNILTLKLNKKNKFEANNASGISVSFDIIPNEEVTTETISKIKNKVRTNQTLEKNEQEIIEKALWKEGYNYQIEDQTEPPLRFQPVESNSDSTIPKEVVHPSIKVEDLLSRREISELQTYETIKYVVFFSPSVIADPEILHVYVENNTLMYAFLGHEKKDKKPVPYKDKKPKFYKFTFNEPVAESELQTFNSIKNKITNKQSPSSLLEDEKIYIKNLLHTNIKEKCLETDGPKHEEYELHWGWDFKQKEKLEQLKEKGYDLRISDKAINAYFKVQAGVIYLYLWKNTPFVVLKEMATGKIRRLQLPDPDQQITTALLNKKALSPEQKNTLLTYIKEKTSDNNYKWKTEEEEYCLQLWIMEKGEMTLTPFDSFIEPGTLHLYLNQNKDDSYTIKYAYKKNGEIHRDNIENIDKSLSNSIIAKLKNEKKSEEGVPFWPDLTPNEEAAVFKAVGIKSLTLEPSNSVVEKLPIELKSEEPNSAEISPGVAYLYLKAGSLTCTTVQALDNEIVHHLKLSDLDKEIADSIKEKLSQNPLSELDTPEILAVSKIIIEKKLDLRVPLTPVPMKRHPLEQNQEPSAHAPVSPAPIIAQGNKKRVTFFRDEPPLKPPVLSVVPPANNP